MPGMDGLAMLQVIRSYLRWATIPVSFLTAYAEDPRLWHVGDLGVSRVFAKAKASLAELRQWVEDQEARASPLPGSDPPSAQAGA
jgi:CheY-like chemotaxis protein